MISVDNDSVTGHASSPAAKRTARQRERQLAAGLVRIELFVHESNLGRIPAVKERLSIANYGVTKTPISVTGHPAQSMDFQNSHFKMAVANLYHEFLEYDWRFFISLGGIFGLAGWIGAGVAMLTV